MKSDLENWAGGVEAARGFHASGLPLEAASERVFDAYNEFDPSDWTQRDHEGLLLFRLSFTQELHGLLAEAKGRADGKN